MSTTPPPDAHVTFLEGWKFFLALGTLVSIPIATSVWMLEQHEKTVHPGAISRDVFEARMEALENLIRDMKP